MNQESITYVQPLADLVPAVLALSQPLSHSVPQDLLPERFQPENERVVDADDLLALGSVTTHATQAAPEVEVPPVPKAPEETVRQDRPVGKKGGPAVADPEAEPEVVGYTEAALAQLEAMRSKVLGDIQDDSSPAPLRSERANPWSTPPTVHATPNARAGRHRAPNATEAAA